MAVANLRPSSSAPSSLTTLCGVMNTMLDASLPLTVPEYEEWAIPTKRLTFATCWVIRLTITCRP